MLEDGIISTIPFNKGALVLCLRVTRKRRGESKGAQGKRSGDDLGGEAHIGRERRSKNGLERDVGSFGRQWSRCYIEKAAGQECISTGGGGEQVRKEPCVYLIRVVIGHSEGEGTQGRSSR